MITEPELAHEAAPGATRLPLSYILPVRSESPAHDLDVYIAQMGPVAEVIVVDGSPPAAFEDNHRRWAGLARHVRVDPGMETGNGKVGGVLTGLRLASYEVLVIADDDVRWSRPLLERAQAELDACDVVRPQNFFDSLPWHARWDNGRTLMNRMLGGDWPGTVVVRASVLRRVGGYDGEAMFENLELVRTITAGGGRQHVALDLFVPRAPPPARPFLQQRVRQAYDELARPGFLLAQLALIPISVAGRLRAVLALCAGSIALAEAGRRRGDARAVFGPTAALWAPMWLTERAVTSWLALGSRLFLGGVRYRGRVLRLAAHSERDLRRLLA